MTWKLRSEIQRFKKMWFSYQEVADDLKSIAIPHVHFIKNKKDVIGA